MSPSHSIQDDEALNHTHQEHRVLQKAQHSEQGTLRSFSSQNSWHFNELAGVGAGVGLEVTFLIIS